MNTHTKHRTILGILTAIVLAVGVGFGPPGVVSCTAIEEILLEPRGALDWTLVGDDLTQSMQEVIDSPLSYIAGGGTDDGHLVALEGAAVRTAVLLTTLRVAGESGTVFLAEVGPAFRAFLGDYAFAVVARFESGSLDQRVRARRLGELARLLEVSTGTG